MKKRRVKKTNVTNLVIVSDMHMNCRLGLCPPTPVKLDDGGSYLASEVQNIVWGWWREFWDEFVPTVCRGEAFAVVVNGDAIDGGAHHGNSTHISDNTQDQERMALTVLEPIVEACEGRYYHIRGTEVHAGRSGVDEEALAKRLGAVPDVDGRFARWELWFRLGKGLVHVMHHIGTSGASHYEVTAVHKEMVEAMVESARWGEELPNVIVRSHRHRNSETRIQTERGFCTSVTTPGWQLKTPFAYRIPGARQSRPQFGGIVVRYGGAIGDEDTFTRPFVRSLGRPPIEESFVGKK